METRKLNKGIFEELEVKVKEIIEEQERKVTDIGNKQVGIDNYLKKYLPYNTFVSFMEVMHVCLS